MGRIPKRYQVVGDVALVKVVGDVNVEEMKHHAKKLFGRLKSLKTVCFVSGIEGEFRIPRIVYKVGDSTETIHKEHGILYKLDVSKIMFSKGNLNERMRIRKISKDGEIVVDMFAGIGYFSLGIAKSHPSSTVYAIEKNPTSCKYLKENVKLNKLPNVVPICGDNREVDFPMADRIIMGYFPHTEKFLDVAKKKIKYGGIVHFHNSYKMSEFGRISDDIKKLGNVEIIGKKIVKSIAPRTYHVVVDVRVWNKR